MSLIIGADLNSRKAAFCALETKPRSLTFNHVTFTAPSKLSRAATYGWLLSSCKNYFVNYVDWAEYDERPVPRLFVESPIVAGARNIQSTIKVAGAWGAVLAAASLAGVEHVYPVAVSQWKKGTVGNGNAGKPAVREWLAREHGRLAAECGRDQDLFDATCIALYGQECVRRGDQVLDGLLEQSRLS